MQTNTTTTVIIPFLDEVLEEAAELRLQWDALSDAIPLWHPRNEGEDDDSGANGDNDDDSSDNDDDNDDSSSDDDSEDDDDDVEVVRVPKAEHDAMRRELAQRRRAEKREKEKKAQQGNRKKVEAGRFQEIIDEKDLEIDELKAANEKLQSEIVATKSKVLISRVAKRLNFDDPEDAEVYFGRYAREGEDPTKEGDVEAVLKRILRAKPKLKVKSSPTGGPTGGGTNGKITFEDIAKMPQSEIDKRYHDPDFQAALQAGPTT